MNPSSFSFLREKYGQISIFQQLGWKIATKEINSQIEQREIGQIHKFRGDWPRQKVSTDIERSQFGHLAQCGGKDTREIVPSQVEIFCARGKAKKTIGVSVLLLIY
jgi:hypothetical protein